MTEAAPLIAQIHGIQACMPGRLTIQRMPPGKAVPMHNRGAAL
jgi:hypothetical protein